MATYGIEEVTTRAELDAVAACIWAAYHEDTAHKIFFQARADPAASLGDSQERLWQEHTGDPSSHWIFVRDPLTPADTLRVLGACQWRFYKENPFPHGVPHFVAEWWPEGTTEREFADEFIKQNVMPRALWMARPHSGLSWCVTRPECQRQGIGRALMQWGVQRTDALGLESYIEASSVGRKLYEAMGYKLVAIVETDMRGKGEGKDWERLEQTYLPFRADSMWRPVHGVWEPEEPERTWQLRRQLHILEFQGRVAVMSSSTAHKRLQQLERTISMPTSKPWIPLGEDGWSREDSATATCYCGAVQLAFPVEGDGLVDTFICNCTDCRKITASMFASNFIVKDSALRHIRGQTNLTRFAQSKTIATGHEMANYFCKTCGSLMYRVSSGFPGNSILRIGTVDDFHLHETKLKPRIEQFGKDRVSWFKGGEGVEQVEGNYYT